MSDYHRTAFCSCGTEFNARDRWQRSCEKCITAKKAYEAQHPRPLRICDDCGCETRQAAYGLCPTCLKAHHARLDVDYKAWKAAYKHEREQEKPAQKKPRQRRVCECGRKFYTSAKLGTETMCRGCYAHEVRKFWEWTDTLSDKEHTALLNALNTLVVELGITVDAPDESHVEVEESDPEEIPADDQDDIDEAFAEIMAGIDL